MASSVKQHTKKSQSLYFLLFAFTVEYLTWLSHGLYVYWNVDLICDMVDPNKTIATVRGRERIVCVCVSAPISMQHNQYYLVVKLNYKDKIQTFHTRMRQRKKTVTDLVR